MPNTVVIWFDEPIVPDVIKGIAHGSLVCGDTIYELRCKPEIMLASARHGAVAYAAFIGETAGNVLAFKRKKKGKH